MSITRHRSWIQKWYGQCKWYKQIGYTYKHTKRKQTTRMWANAQRDGRPVEYRWRPLFSAAKFGWRPLLECRAVTLPRRETRWNLLGCPKSLNGSQPLVYCIACLLFMLHSCILNWWWWIDDNCEDVWGRYCSLTSFFLIVDACLSCKDIAQQSCAMVPRWRVLGDFLGPAFPASRVQYISDLHSKFTRATPCVDSVEEW